MGEHGQAMLEYALLTAAVVVGSMATYVNGGWLSAVQNYVHDVLVIVTLPMP
jgi:uncharacterized protein (UPF0333 family)